MKQSVPKSIDEYIAAQPEAVRPKLEQVRAAIRRAVPEAVEGIGYRMPGYKLHGKPMLYFAAFKEHYSLFAASGTFFAALEDELRGYELRKGTVHFPLTEQVPVKLIVRIAKLRAAGIAATAKRPLLGRKKERRKRRGPAVRRQGEPARLVDAGGRQGIRAASGLHRTGVLEVRGSAGRNGERQADAGRKHGGQWRRAHRADGVAQHDRRHGKEDRRLHTRAEIGR